jgi:hypothetical protein
MKNFLKKWLLPPGILDFVNRTLNPTPRQITQSSDDKARLQKTGELRDKNLNEDCFIIGAGSSIKHQDLAKLVGKNCITVSNVYVHSDINIIAPVYHVLPNIFLAHAHLHGNEKYVEWLSDMDARLPSATKIIMDIRDKEHTDNYKLFTSREMVWCGYSPWDEGEIKEIDHTNLPRVWSVSETAIMMAIFLGFKKIYLLGFDHDWFNGIFNYFYDKNTCHKIGADLSKVAFADSEFQMRRHAYIFRKYKALYKLHGAIFNCNYDQNSYVDIFPKLSLQEALSGAVEKSS